MKAISRFIVVHRRIILLCFIALMVYCVWGMGQVNVEYDITSYLPQETDTRKAIDIMNNEFTTFGTCKIMLRNITFSDSYELHKEICDIPGVRQFEFENTPEYYKNSCALFNITFDGDENDPISVNAYNTIVQKLQDRDLMVAVQLVDTFADELEKDINFVLLLAIGVIILVVTFTSKSFAEVLVFLITFGVAALLNMGTNYWFGTISFISHSVCVILQLALAIDYAIILSHRFSESKEHSIVSPEEVMIDVLAKAFPEISGSSLTTISGLLALTTMSLRLGADLGIVLAKSIICSMITVFLFMPGLLLLFNKAIDKTKHKNFVPSISFVGKINVKLRYVLPAVFLVVVCTCAALSFQTDYVYTTNSIQSSRPSDMQKAQSTIDDIFGYSNQFVILIPGKDYEQQKQLMDFVENYDMITNAVGISNVSLEANGIKHYLTEGLNYSQFAEFLNADNVITDQIFSAYAFLSQDDTKKGMEEVAVYKANRDIYKVSVLELCDCAFLHDDFITAILYNDKDSLKTYEDLRKEIQDAEAQLIGNNYCRMLFEINGELEGNDTFDLISNLLVNVKAIYPDVVFAGNSMSAYDLDQSFSMDNIKVSLLTILFVFIILMFTFKSWGLPIPLTLTIQGAIFINFSYYAIMGVNLFFFVYLIVSAIQMGATIDYAIVITNRYESLKNENKSKNQAIIQAINEAFPTIITSGTIMAVAGFLIGGVVGDPLIATLGNCLGRGVIISIISVMFVLPACLLIFDKYIAKTYFKPSKKVKDLGKLNKLTQKFMKEVNSIQEANNENSKEIKK